VLPSKTVGDDCIDMINLISYADGDPRRIYFWLSPETTQGSLMNDLEYIEDRV
jgi:hypothetical protein